MASQSFNVYNTKDSKIGTGSLEYDFSTSVQNNGDIYVYFNLKSLKIAVSSVSWVDPYNPGIAVDGPTLYVYDKATDNILLSIPDNVSNGRTWYNNFKNGSDGTSVTLYSDKSVHIGTLNKNNIQINKSIYVDLLSNKDITETHGAIPIYFKGEAETTVNINLPKLANCVFKYNKNRPTSALDYSAQLVNADNSVYNESYFKIIATLKRLKDNATSEVITNTWDNNNKILSGINLTNFSQNIIIKPATKYRITFKIVNSYNLNDSIEELSLECMTLGYYV